MCSDRARWENKIPEFLDPCMERARWESDVGDFVEACRDIARRQTWDRRIPLGLQG